MADKIPSNEPLPTKREGLRKPEQHYQVDAYQRSPEAERQINEVFAITFNGEAAEAVLDYLRSITMFAVAGPEISNEALRHLEGQRYLVGLMEKRINDGRSKKP